MGTSQSYKIKSTPNWAKTKRAMTHLATPGNMNDANVNRFLGNFSRAVSEERVFGGAGGSSIGNFLDFIANIRDLGWEQAIQTIDPDIDVSQLSLEAFLEFLLELCCKNDSNLDDQAANVAFQEMEGEIRTELDTAQDLAELFTTASEELLLEWVAFFYVSYIMQIFDELYYTHLEERGVIPEEIMNRLRDYVESSVNELMLNKPDDFNIFSDLGKEFVKGIIDDLNELWEQLSE